MDNTVGNEQRGATMTNTTTDATGTELELDAIQWAAEEAALEQYWSTTDAV